MINPKNRPILLVALILVLLLAAYIAYTAYGMVRGAVL